LSLPHDGQREDAIRRGVFEVYIRNNVDSWFEWSKNIGLGVLRTEDLILVSGCTLVTSWGAAVFLDYGQDEAAISLADHALPNGGGKFVWGNINRVVPHHNSQLESVRSSVCILSPWTDFLPSYQKDNSSPTMNQCVFIRGFRAKRKIFYIKLRGAAEPRPDDPDNCREDEVQVMRIPDDSSSHDPLIGVLNYIAQVGLPEFDRLLQVYLGPSKELPRECRGHSPSR